MSSNARQACPLTKATASVASPISYFKTYADFSTWGAFIFAFRTSGCPLAEVLVRFPLTFRRVVGGLCSQFFHTGNRSVPRLAILSIVGRNLFAHHPHFSHQLVLPDPLILLRLLLPWQCKSLLSTLFYPCHYVAGVETSGQALDKWLDWLKRIFESID